MKKATLILAAVGAVGVAMLVVGPRILRDPEVSNPYDLADGADAAAPDQFSSDPELLKRGQFAIIEQIVEEGTDAGMDGAPYFLELSDGRYVFGHSDRSGRTRRIYARQPIQHRVYWYDDALAKWNERHSPSGGAGRAARPADGSQIPP